METVCFASTFLQISKLLLMLQREWLMITSVAVSSLIFLYPFSGFESFRFYLYSLYLCIVFIHSLSHLFHSILSIQIYQTMSTYQELRMLIPRDTVVYQSGIRPVKRLSQGWRATHMQAEGRAQGTVGMHRTCP